MKVVIIGGVAAGASCAARLRRLDENLEIVMIDKSSHVSYANCGLPYYIGNVIKDESALTVQTPESFKERFNVDARTNNEAISIDRKRKVVTIFDSNKNASYEEAYDKLVLALGAKPIIPQIEGIENELIFTLRNVYDAHKLNNFINENNPKKALVIGGGFIGIETCENLRMRGIEVTLIEASNQIMGNFDEDMSKILNNELLSKNVNLKINERVLAFKDQIKAITDKGEYEADFVVLAIGVTPDTKLAAACGLELGIRNSLVVNEYLQTSDEDIYAGGDMISYRNHLTNKLELAFLAGPANKQGRIMADNICGIKTSYHGFNQTSILKLFDLSCATTGLNQKRAHEYGYDYDYVITSPANHASYYPGFTNMFIKVLFDKKNGQILGGQIIGNEGVDKRIDSLATTIYNKGTFKDLINLDLAYAPAYSSAKDPVNMVGYVIENVYNGLVSQKSYQDANDGMIIDVSKNVDYETGHFDGAINIPLEELRSSLDSLDKTKKYYLNCRSGLRSYVAARIMIQKGFDVANIKGGYNFYKATLTKEMKKEKPEIKEFVKNNSTISAEEMKRVKGLGFLWCKNTNCFNGRIITRNGIVTNEELACITEAAHRFGNGSVALTTRLTIEVQQIPFENIDPFISFLGENNILTGGTGSKVRPVVACKGTTCQYGLIDTNGLSLKLHELFYIKYHDLSLPHKFKIAVGGCPNNCVKPDLNDLGIVGQKIPVVDLEKCRGCGKCSVVSSCPIHSSSLEDGKINLGENCNHCGRCVGKCPFKAINSYQQGYKVYIGGRWGKSINMGRPLTKIFTSEEEVIEIVDKAILLFRRDGLSGERFSDTINRLGFDYVNELLLSDELLLKKNEILGLKVVGGATC